MRFWPWSRFHALELENQRLHDCIRRLKKRTRVLEDFKHDHDSRSKRREWWLTKGGPSIAGFIILGLTLNTAFHWLG